MMSFRSLFVVTVLLSTFVSVSAENMLTVTVGPCWPRATLDETERRTAGDASLGYGIMFERKVGVGAGIDFLWNTRVESREDTSGEWRDTLSRRSFMFPIYGFIVIDPLSHLFIHPALAIQVGYNSHAFRFEYLDSAGNLVEDTENSKYYYGLFVRLALDAHYDFGEFAGVMAGISYHWANTRTGGSGYRRRDMSAFGLHGGFRFIF